MGEIASPRTTRVEGHRGRGPAASQTVGETASVAYDILDYKGLDPYRIWRIADVQKRVERRTRGGV